jgi:hypothetical protein
MTFSFEAHAVDYSCFLASIPKQIRNVKKLTVSGGHHTTLLDNEHTFEQIQFEFADSEVSFGFCLDDTFEGLRRILVAGGCLC